MEELTRERAHDLCVEAWNDIAENGYTRKDESYLLTKYEPLSNCFACEFYIDCDLGCPLFDNNIDCDTDGQHYANWIDGINRKESAIAIADLFID